MPKAKTNYTKTAVLQMFRKWADADSTWQHHVDKLAKVQCEGVLKSLPAGAPANAPRHAAEGTSLDKVGLRHAMRDICVAVELAPSVSHEVMGTAFADREQTQLDCDLFCDGINRTGQYYRRRSDIERLKSAQERAMKISVLDNERRRLASIRDNAADHFRGLEDKAFGFNKTAIAYGAAFPGFVPWTIPSDKMPIDRDHIAGVRVNEVDFDELVLTGQPVWYVDCLGGGLLGHTEYGPVYFEHEQSGRTFIDGDYAHHSLSRDVLSADRVREVCIFFAGHPKFTNDKPKGSKFLFQEYPDLLAVAPTNTLELDEALSAAIPESARSEW